MSIQKLIDAGAIIIDVRTSDECEAGMYPHAIHIPLADIKADSTVCAAYKDNTIILYCVSGARSKQAVAILRVQGYDVHNGGGYDDMMHYVR